MSDGDELSDMSGRDGQVDSSTSSNGTATSDYMSSPPSTINHYTVSAHSAVLWWHIDWLNYENVNNPLNNRDYQTSFRLDETGLDSGLEMKISIFKESKFSIHAHLQDLIFGERGRNR
jgi:hypothetical protein